MKHPIGFIGISREITANDLDGINTNVTVRIYRRGEDGRLHGGAGIYETNPFLAGGKISGASVMRAKRAQLALAEQAQARENE